MKNRLLKLILLFVVVLLISGYFTYREIQQKNTIIPNPLTTNLNFRLSQSDSNFNYSIFAEIDSNSNLKVKCIFRFINNEKLKKISFLLPMNGLKSNSTHFAIDKQLSESEKTFINIHKISINGISAKYHYLIDSNLVYFDSTIIELTNNSVSDTLNVEFTYSIKLPFAKYFIGKASDLDFLVLKNWYPIYIRNVYRQKYFTQFASLDLYYSNYSAQIKYPTSLIPITSAKVISDKNGKIIVNQSNSHELLLFFAEKDEFQFSQSEIKNREIVFYYQKKDENYLERISIAIKKTIGFYDSLGLNLPNKLTFVSLPRTIPENFSSKSLMGFHIPLFSPIFAKEPEFQIVTELSKQIFREQFSVSENYDKWLISGLSEYYSNRIFSNYYGKISQYFNLLGYLPLEGEVFYSYNEIPIIYRFRNYEFEPYLNNLNELYNSENRVSLKKSAYEIFSKDSFRYQTIIKPSLSLKVVENYFGKKKIDSITRSYFINYRNSTVSSDNYLYLFKKYIGTQSEVFIENLYNTNSNFDFSILELNEIRPNFYNLVISRNGGSFLPVDINVYTENDTLNFSWNGNDEIKHFFFQTNYKVIGAEIDPMKKNILDINISNNSISTSNNFTTPFSFAIHWFFWVQNSLMFLGLLG